MAGHGRENGRGDVSDKKPQPDTNHDRMVRCLTEFRRMNVRPHAWRVSLPALHALYYEWETFVSPAIVVYMGLAVIVDNGLGPGIAMLVDEADVMGATTRLDGAT